MSMQTIAQKNADYHYWRSRRLIQILNSIGLEYQITDNLTPLQLNECFHMSLHEYINETPLPIDTLPDEVLYTPHLILHALNHAKQTNIYYREDCRFWEDLPEPTVEEAVRDVFGLRAVLPPAKTSAERQADNFLSHRSFHERLAAEARAEIEAEELTAASEVPPVETQNQSQETMLYPTFKGLSLKNADRVQKDGYLLYVGSRNDCLRAVNQYQKGTAKPNSKNGHSWKFLLTLEDFNSMSSTLTFNFKQFAVNAIQSYKAKQEPKQETLWYNLPTNPNPSTSYSDDLLEEIATY